MAAPKGLQWLVKVNDFLEQVPMGVLKYFKSLIRSIEEMSQAQVDIACTWVAWKVNRQIERVRQRVIKTLYEQYGGTLALLKLVQTTQKVARDPIGALGDFIGVFTKPISVIVSWVSTLMVEVPRLAKNLAEIATIEPPAPPRPDINFHAFKLQVNTITIQDIIMGPEGMPSPEEMFPEPEKPSGRKAFDAAFQPIKKTVEEVKEEKIVYRLKEPIDDINV